MSEGTLIYRIGELEKDLASVTEHLRKVERHEEQISGTNGLVHQVKGLAEEVAGLRKAILTFALGLPVAGVTFMLGVLALTSP